MSQIEVASVNGVISPIDRATVPISDHGFLYGESVYETIRTYGRRPFLVGAHLDRLARSAAAIRLPLPWDHDHIAGEIRRTLQAAVGDGEWAIRVMATRGAGPLGYDPDLCPTPTLVVLVRRLETLTPVQQETGIDAVIASIRRNPIESLDPRIKSSNLLNNILAAHQAKDAGAAEAILFNTRGELAEGTLTNVFLVRGGRVLTPSLECGILSGLTRELLLDLIRESGIPAAQGRYAREDLVSAEEIFLTSTTREIAPVARLDGAPVGGGRRGPVTRRLQELFRARVAEILEHERMAERR